RLRRQEMMKAFRVFLIFFAVFFLPITEARARVYIDLSAPSVKKLQIAVQEFRDVSPAPSADSDRIKKDLLDALDSDIRFSGLFAVTDRAAGLEDPSKSSLEPDAINFKDWRVTGADALLKGAYSVDKDRITVEVGFYDCVNEKQVLGRRYTGSANNPRRLIHYFSDHLYEELTGRKGIFTTKILFVSGRSGKKEVYMSDYDGMNARQITFNRSINLSPNWSADGDMMLYTSYKKGQPHLFSLDLRTGRDAVISEKPGINIGGRFSPDGRQVAMTLRLSSDKSSEIYLLDLTTGRYRRLTDNYGIDVSPSWSPDGKKIAFVSDISGNPNIFVLDLNGAPDGGQKDLKRLTFSGKYNSSPAWSPDGRSIAFAGSENGKTFNIFIMRPNGDDATRLTFDGNNKNPSWSPDSRFIVFSSTNNGISSLYIMRSDGAGLRKLQTGVGNEKTPAWSPFLE
ncbi:MAG: Tol-Pal system beta propeller repeat protein TolB, partial [Deltaproteobacteria bacterium]